MPVRKNIRHPQPSNEETTLSGITGAFADVVHTHVAADTTDFATAVATNETSHADVLVDGEFASAGFMKTDGAATYSIVTDNSTNWNLAYGWGNHAGYGYLDAADIGVTVAAQGHNHDAAYVNVSGDTMTGTLTMDAADIVSTGDITVTGGNVTVDGGVVDIADPTFCLQIESNNFLGTYSTTPGTGATHIGFTAGKFNTSTDLVAIGSKAGQVNTGVYNAFIGLEAGQKNTSGINNLFLGARAGKENISANSNVYIGSYAGFKGTGANNVSIGSSALRNATGAEKTVAIGSAAGYSLITGDNNTFIGYYTGFNTTGSGNVLIGYMAGENETGSNKLYISNSNTTTPLIYGDFSTDELTINGTNTVTDNLVLPKTSGKGIQVDTTTPTFGWRDILGTINTRGIGATDPDWGVIAGGVMSAYKFSLNDVCWISYHIPHDYVPGTSWHSHVHWLPDGTNTAAVKWQMEWMYAKGHNQGAFNVGSITTTSASDTPGGTAYQHYVTESTANSSTNIEPDGIIYMKISRVTNGTGTDNTDGIFVLQCDLHYQSTNIGTKAKAYPFYT